MLLLRALLLSAISILIATSAEGRKGFGPGEQEYGYVDVRKGAHMFYWLYYTTATPTYTKRPLVMWLEGGPGASATSYGNFDLLGPLTADLKPRNNTWVQHVNLLLVDNPVGTGYSYVDNQKLLTTNNKQIARDLIELTRAFFRKYPSFQTVPFYVFGESYGGKVATDFALELEKEGKSGKIKVNFQGVAMGDPWISPADSVMNWAPYLYNFGMLDQEGYRFADAAAKTILAAINEERFSEATTLFNQARETVAKKAGNVNFYNIMSPVKLGSSNATSSGVRDLPDGGPSQNLPSLMDGPVRRAFGNTIPTSVKHETIAATVFENLYEDIMKPVTNLVEQLLNTTTLQVVVYTGQLDVMVNTPGTVAWVDRLKWPMAQFWHKEAKRQEFVVNGTVEGFVKQAENFSMYWINRAGHVVPADNPAALIELLRIVTKFDKM